MGGIPDGWLDYSKIGKPMKLDNVAAKFVSFKVPLKSQLTSSLDTEKVFTPADLLSTCKQQNFKLGLIIDLTFTSRYYQSSDFTGAGVEYVKIPIEGKMVPKKARIEKFAETVKQFLEESEDKDADAVIGVHCTHGVNRTGYVICKYLTDNENMSANEAIDLFNSCRGHDIERENYLDHLRTGNLPVSEKDSYYNGEYTDSKWGKGNADTRWRGEEQHYNSGAGSRNWGDYPYNYSHYNNDQDYSHKGNRYGHNSRGYNLDYGDNYYSYGPSSYNQEYSNHYSHDYYRDDTSGNYSNYSSFEHSSTSRNPRESSHRQKTVDNSSYRNSNTSSYSSNDRQYSNDNQRQHRSDSRSNKQDGKMRKRKTTASTSSSGGFEEASPAKKGR